MNNKELNEIYAEKRKGLVQDARIKIKMIIAAVSMTHKEKIDTVYIILSRMLKDNENETNR